MRFSTRHLFIGGLLTAVFGIQAHAAGTGIAGNYHVDGQNPDGRPYKGALRIEQNGDVYALTWDSGGTTHGIGVLKSGRLVVAYGDAACGVVAYRHNGDALDGTWAMSNSTRTGSETATPSQSTGDAVKGDYVVSGRNVDGSPYKGALFIGDGDGEKKVSLVWRTGPDARGFGFRIDSMLVGTFGPASCGLVAYAVEPDGSLNGQWSFVHGGLGTERAKKAD